jgi:hypothetical protein
MLTPASGPNFQTAPAPVTPAPAPVTPAPAPVTPAPAPVTPAPAPTVTPATGSPTGVRPCYPGETILEFRPVTNWNGEYGFDWMRVYEGAPNAHASTVGGVFYSALWNSTHLRREEMPYIDGASDAVTAYPRPYEANTERGTRHRPAGIAGQGIVWGGYHPSSPLVEISAAKAQEKLKKEYKSLEIARPGTLNYRLKTYYIPWLNLFPDADAGWSGQSRLSVEGFGVVPRLSEVYLQVLHDIKNTPPGKLVIEFDKKFIEINGNNTGSFTLPGPPLHLTPTNHTGSVQYSFNVKIKCIKEISNPEGSSVVVKAFGQNAKPSDKGVWAGELRVCPNTRARHQKEIKIALVRVKTNIMQTTRPGPVTGAFDSAEVRQIFHTMHQALLRPDITNEDETHHTLELDLSGVPEFHDPSLYPIGTRLVPPGSTPGKFIAPGLLIRTHPDLHRFLVNRFNAERVASGRSAITDRYFVFCFGVSSARFIGIADADIAVVNVNRPSHHPSRSGGGGRMDQVAKIRWRPTLIIFETRPKRLDYVVAHELLHALTLRHTHRDWMPLPSGHTAQWTYLADLGTTSSISVGCKYLFPFQTTTNVMSYSDSAHSTWRWQWAIMRANAAIAPNDWTLGKEEKSV